MAYNYQVWNTQQYERACKTASGTIQPGCAIKRPAGPAMGSPLIVAPAGPADIVFGVASSMDPFRDLSC